MAQAQEPEEEDCTQAEKDMIVSDFIKALLYNAGYDTGDNTLTSRGVLYNEANKSTGVTKLPSASKAAPRASKSTRGTKPAYRPATAPKSLIYELLCLPLCRLEDDVMVPYGVMSPEVNNISIVLNETNRVVSIPAEHIRELLFNSVDSLSLWPSNDAFQTVYALLQVDRRLLLDADNNA